MAAHTCAFSVAVMLLLATTAYTEQTKERWSKPIQEAEGRSDWIPLAAPYRDSEVAAQEDVATILRPPEPISIRQQRLVQSPRQARGPPPGIAQPYFPGGQSHLIRFPNEPSPQLRVPHGPTQQFQNPNFRGPQPVFLQPQPVPAGFPPQALTHSPFQPQPIPAFNSKPVTAQRTQNNSFVPAGSDEEVQLVYVPVEALQGPKIPNKQKNNQPTKQFQNPEQAFQDQLRQFVSEQGQVKQHFPSSQEIFEQEKQRAAVVREQEERRRLQEQEIKERQEQEAKIRKEQEERNRKEHEQRLRKEQEYRERQEQEARARKEQELRLKQQKEAKEEEERSRFEANQRFQQQQQQDQNRRPQFTQNNGANLQSKEQAFQQQLQSQTPQNPPTTPAPHQPPLAVYMGASGRTPAVIDDVLFALRDVHTIPVLDRVPDANNPPPRVFVGPAEMRIPEGYSKFDLPYLSSLDSNRVERKVDQLPFFVAPLSYSPPSGYTKIPFPEPHVGSVVVSQRGRQQRPAIPDPIPVSEEYANDDIPTINPAIPLLVNSLQNGRGQKAQRPHVQQQFLSQDQFVPHNQFIPQQQFVPHHAPPQHHFVPQEAPQFLPHPSQEQGQFIQQQVYEEEVPQVLETEAPPTTTEPTTTRRPLHSRGRTRQQLASTTQSPRTRAPVHNNEQAERRPVNRGRRPVSRGRTTTTTPEPVTEEEQVYESSRESNQEHTAPFLNASPAPLINSQPPVFKHNAAPLASEQQFNQPQFQGFEPSSLSSFQREFPSHQQGQGVHASVVQPAVVPQFEETASQRPLSRAPARGNVYQQQQEEFVDPNFDSQAFAEPQHVTPQPHFRQRQQEFQQTPAPEEQQFQRSRPTVYQPVVSSTPDSLLTRQSSPSTPAYPSESPSIKPHHISKGEVGKVKHVPNYPFIPTALPEVSPSASAEPETYRYSPEPEIPLPTAAPVQVGVQYVSATPTPLSYQTPSRPRVRAQEQEETQEPIIATTPRQRVRVSSDSGENTTPSYHSSQRFRGRVQSSREETSEEVTTLAPQRVRTRVNTGRGRVTPTERPRGLQITVADIQKSSSSEETHTEPSTRVRGRFRGVDRGTSARQQLTTRGRKQESSGIDLPQPVRQQSSSTEIPSNESPVYVPEVNLESGFVPAINSQRVLPTTTERNQDRSEYERPIPTTTEKPLEKVTTQKPVRGRFNNFGTGTRVSQRRPVARGSTITASDTATEAPVSTRGRDYNVVRSSRRQQPQKEQQQQVTRVSSLRSGGRIRRPTTQAPEVEEETVTLSTGVSYVKNPYVTIHRPGFEHTPAAGAEEAQEVEQQAPPTRLRSHRPQPAQVEEERYVEPVSRYTASPAEQEYEPQFYSPLPSRAAAQDQQRFFSESTPIPPRQHFSARASTAQPEQYHKEVVPQQYHRDEYDYQEAPRQQRQRTNNPTRYITLDDPENPEYGEESQRSEQISIQQLEGALTASLFNKDNRDEAVDENEKDGELVETELEQIAPSAAGTSLEHDDSTEESETSETVTTEGPRETTLSLDDVTTTTPEPEKKSEKPALHSKSNEGRRRRVRVRTRVHRPGDLFETAESINVHSIVNKKIAHDKNNKDNEWTKVIDPSDDISGEGNEEEYPYEVKLSPPNQSTIDNTNFDDVVEHEDDLIHITTESPENETTEESIATTTVSPVKETTTPVVEVLTTTEAPQTKITTTPSESETNTTPEYNDVISTTESVTTDTEAPVTPRVLGTSTTTEISLETEICYRGRCVKTKVDADQKPILNDDQMPIEK